MKTILVRRTVLNFPVLAAISALLGVAPIANATVYTWNVTTPSSSSTWNSIGNWLPNTAVPGSADEALFAGTGVSASSSSINNVVSASQSVTSLTYDQNGSTAFHVTQVPTGVTLTVSGPFTNGDLSATGALTQVYYTGGGTLWVGGSIFEDDDFDPSASSGAMATLDLSGLNTFIYTNSAGTMELGEDPISGMNRPGSTFNLAGTSNNITANLINFMTLSGGNGGNNNSAINFGAGTNIFNVGTFNIAERKNSGSVKFQTSTGGLRIRGVNGNVDDTSRAAITLGFVNGKTGTVQPTGKLLLAGAGHPLDVKASTVILGSANGANGTSTSFGTGILSFDAGTVDATTINMAVCSMTAGGSLSGASGTINVSNNVTAGTSGTLIIGTGGLSLCNATMFAGTGNLNIFGGTVSSFGNIFKTTATGGSITSIGNITNNAGTLVMQPGTAVGTAAIPVDNFYLNNATLHLSVNDISIITNITATSVPVAGTSTIVIDNIQYYPGGTVVWPLISYTGTDPFSGFNATPTLPMGFTGALVDDTAKQTIDLQITSGVISAPPVPVTWNGGSSTGNNWSDMNNWNGTNLTTGDTLFFDGNNRLNNTNDTALNTIYSNITFNATASAFTLNGNAITLGSINGGITNLSSNPQTVDLGVNFNGNTTLAGGSSGLFVGGPLVNTAATGIQTISLAGNGTLTNQFSIQFNGTNMFFMTNGANWTIADNAGSSPVIISNAGFSILGASTLTFGGTGMSPQLYTLEGGQGSDNALGDTGAAATFNMMSGTLTLGRRLNTQDANLNVSGGTLNIWSQFQVANGVPANVTTITVSGGTLNVASTGGTTAGGILYVASRGTGTLTIGNGLVECSTLDVSRNAAGNTGGSVGVVNLNGGSLQVGGAITNASNAFQTGGSPTATFNFNGGTLSPTKTGVVAFQGSLSAPVIPITTVVKAGGAVIQTSSGKQMIILEPLQHDSTLGGIPDGGLTKQGSDLLTLAAAATYTGNTTISGGILALSGSGSLVSPNIIVAGGTVFDVSGVSSFTLGSGQSLTNSGSTATLNGNASTGSGTVSLTYAAGTPSFTVTNGTLTLSASTVININNTGAALAAGSYEIISTNNDTTGGPNAAVAGTVPSSVTVSGSGLAGGTTASLSISNNELFLVVNSSNLFPGPAPTATYSGGEPVFNFSGAPGDNYSVDQSTNLVNWVVVWTTNAPPGGLFNYTNSYSGPAAFYRLQWNHH